MDAPASVSYLRNERNIPMFSPVALPLPALLFVALVAVVGIVGTGAVADIALQRLGILEARGPRWRRARSAILALYLPGLVCIAYGWLVEPTWLATTHTQLRSAHSPRGRVRIVQLSDIHAERLPRLEDRLPALVSREAPDLIVFTGDALNEREGLPVFRALMGRLSAIAPTFAVRGNWDVWYWPDVDLFGGTGVAELTAGGATLRVRDVDVYVAGIAVGHERALGEVLDRAPRGSLRVLLHHYPDEIEVAARHGADVYLAGHTHGGQVALPLYGALVTFSRFGKRFESGHHRVGATDLYVSRGIGMEGGRMPRVRFCARPELTVIDVSSEAP